MTGPGLENMVQIEAQSIPECQVGVPSQGWQQMEEHRVVHLSTMFKLNIMKVSLKEFEG